MSDRLRAIACVNACAGMADPAAEIAMLKLARERALDAVDAFEEERELNAATQERADLGALVDKLERELTKANAELAAMKKVIRKIYYETETYADGAPDATDHDKLCNDISSQLEPFIR